MLVPRQLNDADEQILDELQHGRASPSYLSELTGLEQTYINQRLRRLDEHGHVENLARGLWELTDDPREEVAAADEDDLRERLRIAIEEREAAQARVERLEAKLKECREQFDQTQAEQAAADVAALRSVIDDLEAAFERGDRVAIQEAITRMRKAIDDV